MPSSSDEPDDKEKDAASCVKTREILDFVVDTHSVQPWCKRCPLLIPTPSQGLGAVGGKPLIPQ